MLRIIERNAGKAPMTYKQFQNIVEGMEPPPKPVPTLTLQMLGSAVTPIAGIAAVPLIPQIIAPRVFYDLAVEAGV